MSYLVHLRQFEGPLGLLLYLIRKEEMDVMDINVHEITKQYLDYIRMMKELDLELAGDFVAMAATLIHIKSRMLLPQYNEEGEEVEVEDPRKELVQKLLEYQRYQEAGKRLYERPLLGRDVYSRGLREDMKQYLDGELVGDIIIDQDGLFSLISMYRKALRKAQRMVHNVRPKVQSIATRVLELKDHLIVGTRVLLHELLSVGSMPRRAQLLVTFLSMLELGRMGYVSLFQSENYGDIYIEPKRPIERNVLERVQEFDSGDAEAVANSIINEAVEEKIDMAEAMAAAGATEPNVGAGALVLAASGAGGDFGPEQLSLDKMEMEPVSEVFTEIASDEDILNAEKELGEGGEDMGSITG